MYETHMTYDGKEDEQKELNEDFILVDSSMISSAEMR